MNTKKLITTCSVVGLLLASSFVFAQRMGTKDGGGGGAYVCRNAKGEVTKTMLVDLWESANDSYDWPNDNSDTLTIIKSNRPATDQFNDAMSKLASVDPELTEAVIVAKVNIFDNPQNPVQDLKPNIKINIPDDLKGALKSPEDCTIEGMMFYKGGRKPHLEVNRQYFNKLETQTDVAASWAHESVYKVLRDRMDHQSSEPSRRLVACLFAQEKDCLTAKDMYSNRPLPQDRALYVCENSFFKAYAYPKNPLMMSQVVTSFGFRTPIWQFVVTKFKSLSLPSPFLLEGVYFNESIQRRGIEFDYNQAVKHLNQCEKNENGRINGNERSFQNCEQGGLNSIYHYYRNWVSYARLLPFERGATDDNVYMKLQLTGKADQYSGESGVVKLACSKLN